jgi:hypothetical protein
MSPKKIKAETREELLAVGIAKFARKLGLRVTDEQAVTYVRNKHTPPGTIPGTAAGVPPPSDPPRPKPQLTPEMERLIAEVVRMYFQRQPSGPGYNPYNPYPGNPYTPPSTAVAQREIPWRVILGFPQNKPVTVEEIQSRYKKLSTVYHPDAGGSAESFRAITEARDIAIRDLSALKGTV